MQKLYLGVSARHFSPIIKKSFRNPDKSWQVWLDIYTQDHVLLVKSRLDMANAKDYSFPKPLMFGLIRKIYDSQSDLCAGKVIYHGTPWVKREYLDAKWQFTWQNQECRRKVVHWKELSAFFCWCHHFGLTAWGFLWPTTVQKVSAVIHAITCMSFVCDHHSVKK